MTYGFGTDGACSAHRTSQNLDSEPSSSILASRLRSYAEASPHLTNHRPASVAKLAKDDATAGSHDAPIASHAASNASMKQSGKLGDLERSKVQRHKIS